jgi:hypothetical protein
MVGKMILPLLGGTPAVWSTCMVFFQAVLLGGYAYAHASAAWLGVRRQMLLHLALLALPLGVLPLAVNPSFLRGGGANPVLDVLLLLSVSVGLPFLVVSATAPLIQKWFTHTGHPAARDPYFLYAASNLGSMLACWAILADRAAAHQRCRGSRRHGCGPYLLLAVLTPSAPSCQRRGRAAAAPDAAAWRGRRRHRPRRRAGVERATTASASGWRSPPSSPLLGVTTQRHHGDRRPSCSGCSRSRSTC